MKLAVISDIHGNLPALEATIDHIDRWQPDLVVVNGDVINRGPRSRQCWNLMHRRRQTHDWRIIGGNHEEYVGSWLEKETNADGPRAGGPRFEIGRSSYWTFRQLDDYISQILDLPEQIELQAPDGSVVRLTHGTMRGKRDGVYILTPDEQLVQQIAPAPDVFCTAHTHRPLVRRLNGRLVINSGSAGTAFDDDPRISYAQLVWRRGSWRAKLVRLAYDRGQAERDFDITGYRQGGGPLVDIFIQEWLLARPLVYRWAERYEEAVLAGDITLQASVDDFLRHELSY